MWTSSGLSFGILIRTSESKANFEHKYIWLKDYSSHGNVHRHLMDVGKVSKPIEYVPHLSVANLHRVVNACRHLLQRHENEPFCNWWWEMTKDKVWINKKATSYEVQVGWVFISYHNLLKLLCVYLLFSGMQFYFYGKIFTST